MFNACLFIQPVNIDPRRFICRIDILPVLCPAFIALKDSFSLFRIIYIGVLDAGYRKTKFLCKFKVPCIMGRYRHNCSSAVSGKYIIGYPNRYWLLINRINGKPAGKYSGFFLCQISTVKIGFQRSSFYVIVNPVFIFFCCYFFNERMLWSYYHIRCSEQGVGTCGKNCQILVQPFNSEIDFCSC